MDKSHMTSLRDALVRLMIERHGYKRLHATDLVDQWLNSVSRGQGRDEQPAAELRKHFHKRSPRPAAAA